MTDHLDPATMRRRLRLIRELHHQDDSNLCAECGDAWPCDTISILRTGQRR